MTEDVLVSVCGMHETDNPEQDEVEVVSAGKYFLKNRKHYIIYDEAAEDGREIIHNRITYRDGRMEVQKKGALTTNMVFDRKEKTSSWYQTPYGTLHTGITVRDMNLTETENLLEIVVDYDLEVNYEHMADSRIRIRVMAKDSGLFHLR